MISFEYYNPAKIIFGEESEKNLKGLLKSYNVKSLLLVYSGDFIKTLGIYSVIEDAVNELGIKFSENGNVVPNPSVELVRELVKQGKNDMWTSCLQWAAAAPSTQPKPWHSAFLTTATCGTSSRKARKPRRC